MRSYYLVGFDKLHDLTMDQPHLYFLWTPEKKWGICEASKTKYVTNMVFTHIGGNLNEKLPMIPRGPSENLKVRQLRLSKPVSLGYWYSRMYHKPINL